MCVAVRVSAGLLIVVDLPRLSALKIIPFNTESDLYIKHVIDFIVKTQNEIRLNNTFCFHFNKVQFINGLSIHLLTYSFFFVFLTFLSSLVLV